jgi:hypothetical protein
MLSRYWALLAVAAMSAPLSAQTVTTKLDAVSGVPEIDKATQTEDVRFRNDRENRSTPARIALQSLMPSLPG